LSLVFIPISFRLDISRFLLFRLFHLAGMVTDWIMDNKKEDTPVFSLTAQWKTGFPVLSRLRIFFRALVLSSGPNPWSLARVLGLTGRPNHNQLIAVNNKRFLPLSPLLGALSLG